MSTNADGRKGTPGVLTIRLDHLRDGGVLVIHASGRVNRVPAPELHHLLDDQLSAQPRAIVLDLRALSVLEAGVVEALDHVARRAGEADIGLCLVTVDAAVIRTLVTVGMDELFDIYPSTEAAWRALS